jgi:hypothetical protein
MDFQIRLVCHKDLGIRSVTQIQNLEFTHSKFLFQRGKYCLKLFVF